MGTASLHNTSDLHDFPKDLNYTHLNITSSPWKEATNYPLLMSGYTSSRSQLQKSHSHKQIPIGSITHLLEHKALSLHHL